MSTIERPTIQRPTPSNSRRRGICGAKVSNSSAFLVVLSSLIHLADPQLFVVSGTAGLLKASVNAIARQKEQLHSQQQSSIRSPARPSDLYSVRDGPALAGDHGEVQRSSSPVHHPWGTPCETTAYPARAATEGRPGLYCSPVDIQPIKTKVLEQSDRRGDKGGSTFRSRSRSGEVG